MALNQACLPGRQHNQHHAQRAVLARFLNGDLASSDVTIYNPNVHIIDEPVRARMLQDIEAFVLAALVPTTCPLFSRSRWNGADGALAWLGLFSAHYNGSLLKHTIQKFVGLPLLQRPGGRKITGSVPLEQSLASKGPSMPLSKATRKLPMQQRQWMRRWTRRGMSKTIVA